MNKKLISLAVSMLLFATMFMLAVTGNNEQPKTTGNRPFSGDEWPQFQQNAGHAGFSTCIGPEDDQLFCSELLNLASGYYWEKEDEWFTPHDLATYEQSRILVEIRDVQ